VRVFLDTNVLASALATRALCADVLRHVMTARELVVSAGALVELRRVLIRKFAVPARFVQPALAMLKESEVPWRHAVRLTLDLRDADDVEIVSAAVAAEADLFVTGDKEIQSLGQVEGLQIVSPRQFWDRQREGREPSSGEKDS